MTTAALDRQVPSLEAEALPVGLHRGCIFGVTRWNMALRDWTTCLRQKSMVLWVTRAQEGSGRFTKFRRPLVVALEAAGSNPVIHPTLRATGSMQSRSALQWHCKTVSAAADRTAAMPPVTRPNCDRLDASSRVLGGQAL